MRFSIHEMTYVALFTALTVATAVFSRFTDSIIPFSLLPFIVMLAGGILGSKLAATSLSLYLLLGLIGLPVFAKAPFGGISYVLQPSFGFLLGFILGAYVIGKIIEHTKGGIISYGIANLLGLTVIYTVGLLYFWGLFNLILGKPMDFTTVMQLGFLPYIIPDLVKGVIAAYLSSLIRKRLIQMNIETINSK